MTVMASLGGGDGADMVASIVEMNVPFKLRPLVPCPRMMSSFLIGFSSQLSLSGLILTCTQAVSARVLALSNCSCGLHRSLELVSI